MNASNHVAAKVASAAGGIAAVLAVCGAADLAARRFGPMAGGVLIVAVFAACWLAHSLGSRRAPRPTRPASDVTVTKPRPLAGLRG